MKMFIITSILYISYVETLFVVAKIIGSPGTNDILLFYSKVCDYVHYEVLSVIMTITVLLPLAFSNARTAL